ncbi:cysteine proteinase 2 precursor, putative [Entamoeba dispar SAW760]|uniref:Cysteine proteinase 2, putative n=1 Tax=Entamoeba dispar (strain ATCC PRA-260 / SAW760) TaxID=370354 RepID=B0ENK4_ENTDS|nr:cysteine proteinase 2 precursor, putative [Entamoeba dispar SAW760]EDR23885.1 cysteine proteinase 2 precursor, putative [Entamoeba dispar SAW760]|eukprot:EDR23885.1 cysteine proteinase 2 precursor, putative [Entamoeba dispar SAW760]
MKGITIKVVLLFAIYTLAQQTVRPSITHSINYSEHLNGLQKIQKNNDKLENVNEIILNNSNDNDDDLFNLELPDEILWENFCKYFNKSYSTTAEVNYRKNIFMEQIKTYRYFNSLSYSNTTAVFGITILSDKSLSEIGCSNPKSLKNTSTIVPPPILPQIIDPPSSFSRCGKYALNNSDSMKTDDFCTDIYWSGCDGCYAFAAKEIAFISYKNQTLKNASINTNLYFDCSPEAKGCCGGDTEEILKSFPYVYFQNESSNSEQLQYLSCKHEKCLIQHPNGLVKNIIKFGSINKPEQFKSLLLVYGPFVSSIKLFNGIQGYKYGILDIEQCKNESIIASHTIVVVGYGIQNNSNYLIVKNWWNGWGEDEKGYMKISMDNSCGIGTQPEGKQPTNYIIQFYYCEGDSYCIDCDKETGKCLECSYLSRLDKNGMCTRECPGDCLTCDKALEECFSCKNNAVLQDGKCVIKCPKYCKTCERETLECTSCQPPYKLNGTECIYNCTDDCEICDSYNETCIKCKDKSELINGYCNVLCPVGCKTCDRESQRCYSCKRFYRLNKFSCVRTCKDKCIDCDSSNTFCELCEVGYTLLNGDCYSSACKKNCRFCNITTLNCVECFLPYFGYNGDCQINSFLSLVFLYTFITLSLLLNALL